MHGIGKKDKGQKVGKVGKVHKSLRAGVSKGQAPFFESRVSKGAGPFQIELEQEEKVGGFWGRQADMYAMYQLDKVQFSTLDELFEYNKYYGYYHTPSRWTQMFSSHMQNVLDFLTKCGWALKRTPGDLPMDATVFGPEFLNDERLRILYGREAFQVMMMLVDQVLSRSFSCLFLTKEWLRDLDALLTRIKTDQKNGMINHLIICVTTQVDASWMQELKQALQTIRSLQQISFLVQLSHKQEHLIQGHESHGTSMYSSDGTPGGAHLLHLTDAWVSWGYEQKFRKWFQPFSFNMVFSQYPLLS